MPTPVEGGKQAIAEAYRNLCAVGATPLAATDCMNFGNPQRPEIMGQFVGCIEGMAEACQALDFPIVSGNVSLYNETKAEDGGGQRHPADSGDRRSRAAQGLAQGGRRSPSRAPATSSSLIGERRGHLGQSLWLREIHGREEGPPPPVDLAAERSAGEFVRAAIAGGAITACHDVSDGGLAVALAEMALAGNVGAMINKLDGRRRAPASSPRIRASTSPRSATIACSPSSPGPMPPESRSRRSAAPAAPG